MSTSSFEIVEKENQPEGTVRFTVKGQINSISAPALQHELETALSSGRTNIILNMTFVEYLNSAGIRILLKTYKDAMAAGGRFAVEYPSDNVKNVLGMTALDELMLK